MGRRARQIPSGQLPSGHIPSGKTPPGKTPPGKTPPGETPPGETPPGKNRPGRTWSGRPRLHDMRIRGKLSLILVVPILAIVGLAADRLIDSGARTGSAASVAALTTLSGDVAEVTQRLQDERMAAAAFLSDPAAQPAAFDGQAARSAAAIAGYTARRDATPVPAGALTQRLDAIDDQLSTLPAIRIQVRGRQPSPDEASLRYTVVIDELVGYDQDVSQIAGDAQVAAMLRALGAFAQAKAQTADEQVIGYLALRGGRSDAQRYTSFIATLTGQQSALAAFELDALPDQQRLVNSTITGDAVELADSEGRAVTRGAGATGDDLARALGAVVDLMRWTEQRLQEQALAAARSQQVSVLREVVIESVLVTLALALAVALALLLARTMARSLSTLREGALAVAGTDLPLAVARLRDARAISRQTPEQITAEILHPIDVRSRDEIGQVAQAFNTVHREALRVAAEQAALRTTVSAMFVNLARRSQSLVDRMIAELDLLERGEQDADRLARLFQLDHLATRMRRNDENLLVLSDADSTTPRPDDAPFGDVLYAAECEVEFFDRIAFGAVDADVSISAVAVNDVVRLLAELFDNAARFSPPHTPVIVDGRRIGDRAVVQIEDRGLGVPENQLAELNARLAEEPEVDVAAFRMMGLCVVSRLAHRHGITVELLANAEGGTTAVVMLPPAVLALPRLRGPAAALPGFPVPGDPPGFPVPGDPPGFPVPGARHGDPAPAGVVGFPVLPRQRRHGDVAPPAPPSWPLPAAAAPAGGGSGTDTPGDRAGAHVAGSHRGRAAPPRPSRAPESWFEDAAPGTGLPRRDPAAYLVPGAGGEPAGPGTVRRSPEEVRGTLAAYRFGVDRGRDRIERAAPDAPGVDEGMDR